MGEHEERLMRLPIPGGYITLAVRDGRTAARVGAYWRAVRRYVETGDAGPLSHFEGRSIVVDGRGYPYITDTDTLDRPVRAGSALTNCELRRGAYRGEERGEEHGARGTAGTAAWPGRGVHHLRREDAGGADDS